MTITKILTTAKRNPVTRVRFYQSSVIPIDIYQNAENELKLQLNQRFVIEIENNSNQFKDYAYSLTIDEKVNYLSP